MEDLSNKDINEFSHILNANIFTIRLARALKHGEEV